MLGSDDEPRNAFRYTPQDNHTANDIAREAAQLLDSKRTAIGRAMRRFLQRWTENGSVCQVLADGRGHTPEQLGALSNYATYLADKAQLSLPVGVAVFESVAFDARRGYVAARYYLGYDVHMASVRQLRAMVQVVQHLAELMSEFALNVNAEALRDCPEYKYRNFPYDIVSDASLWCVSGHDVMGGSGVLEWCTQESDAHYIREKMERFPGRFTELKAEKWSQVQMCAAVPQ